MISNNIILVDIDGVVLDWATPFYEYITNVRGYKRLDTPVRYSVSEMFDIPLEQSNNVYNEFNERYAFNLPPTHDSLEYMPKISEEFGIKFHAVTKMGRNIYCMRNRIDNLIMFGDIWSGIDFFHEHECKSDVLGREPYLNSGCMWVEDLTSNAIVGKRCGLNPILMNNPWNENDHLDGITRVYSWADIYKMLNNNNKEDV